MDKKNSAEKSIDYGPLAVLVGEWRGDKGMDISLAPEEVEKSPYYETITCWAAGDVTNAEEQVLAVVRYHQVVSRKSNDEVFHDQIGYWLWDSATQMVMQTLTIPRGVCVTATGKAVQTGLDDFVTFSVRASEDDRFGSIAQSAFMADKARTISYVCEFVVKGDAMSYNQTTLVDIYQSKAFEHTDRNKLVRVKS